MNCPTKPTCKGVTTQIEALYEYFVMVMFMLLLNTVHGFANVILNLYIEAQHHAVHSGMYKLLGFV